MIRNPIILVLLLIAIETAVLYVSGRKDCRKFFHFLPPVFWIYFLPMIAATLGLIDTKSPVYPQLSNALLPASLILLLLSSDMKAIARLGRPALIMMLAGSVGIMLGMPMVFFIFKNVVGAQMWSGFGALSASWIGGSANMIAVKEAIGTPEAVFAPMVIVDTVVPYVWMGLLIAGSAYQKIYDRLIRADRRMIDDLNARMTGIPESVSRGLALDKTAVILLTAAAGGALANFVSGLLPVIKNVLSQYSWTIIAASLLGMAGSFSPLRNLERWGASRIGYYLLYFVLTTIGARAGIADLGAVLPLILAGFCVVIFQGFVLILCSRLLRAPMFLAATAAQANIGGVASAPVVAAIYEPGLASVGLLMAILGNIMGTYLGIITSQLCRMVSL